MIDQRKLPFEEIFIEHEDYREVADSIRKMVIRGAPAIGIAAAMGVALGINSLSKTENDLNQKYLEIKNELAETRPTAVNLFWALSKMDDVFKLYSSDITILKKKMIEKALELKTEDEKINRLIGKNGSVLIKNGDTVLTHCNAGSLATAGYGTALGVLRSAKNEGKEISVIAGETRPFLQGARLTVWEMQKENIPVFLITDSMAGYMMSEGRIDLVVVGADRIAQNGDVANKVGTYSLAVLSDFHRIPFYVAAPVSTIDRDIKTGRDIPIEERSGDEVTSFCGERTALPGTNAYNPAFDVTPFRLISGIITEKGIIRDNPEKEISELFR